MNRLALDLLFPRRCLGCGAYGHWICERCGRELSVAGHRQEVTGISVESAFDFEIPLIRESLHLLKYEGIRDLAAELADRAEADMPKDAVLIPVPVSPARRKSRGYNQAEEIARALGRRHGLPVWAEALAREGSGKSQVGKTAEERRTGEKGFRWLGLREAEYADRPWVLVDDLVTTGSTLRACLEALAPHAMRGLSAVTLAFKR